MPACGLSAMTIFNKILLHKKYSFIIYHWNSIITKEMLKWCLYVKNPLKPYPWARLYLVVQLNSNTTSRTTIFLSEKKSCKKAKQTKYIYCSRILPKNDDLNFQKKKVKNLSLGSFQAYLEHIRWIKIFTGQLDLACCLLLAS